ncbi:hypothetical protein EV421DRAFT_1906618 [Armillaria borealis]|uniref:Uncharacterized protein n=1 Tax=Armillaria borealis TaxID=47425 RepID=A0AA39MLS2_9AGAR|nr:hypothetical protein EV421DRAFT_1906618 [Armillaria borealis]
MTVPISLHQDFLSFYIQCYVLVVGWIGHFQAQLGNPTGVRLRQNFLASPSHSLTSSTTAALVVYLSLLMNINIFSAGYARLRPLFDTCQYTKLWARNIAVLLNENHEYLLSLCFSAHEHPDALISPFFLDMVHTCQEIAVKLPAYAQLPLFQDWELQLLRVAFSQATTRKHRLEELEAEREEVQEPESDETKPQAGTSSTTSKTPMKLLTKTTAKATAKAGSQVLATTAINEEMVEVPTSQVFTFQLSSQAWLYI